MRTWFLICVLCLSLVTIIGCGDGRPTRVPVSGQVLIDGKPLTHGKIQFIPPNGRASQGRLDKDGRFRLTCYEESDGAILGVHSVAIVSADAISTTKTRWHAPKKLADQRTSGLSQEITGPTDNLIINISWDGGQEFIETEEAGGEEFLPAGARANSEPNKS